MTCKRSWFGFGRIKHKLKTDEVKGAVIKFHCEDCGLKLKSTITWAGAVTVEDNNE